MRVPAYLPGSTESSTARGHDGPASLVRSRRAILVKVHTTLASKAPSKSSLISQRITLKFRVNLFCLKDRLSCNYAYRPDPATYQETWVPDWASCLTVRLVRSDERERWRTLMTQQHYLGFRGSVGESLYDVAELDQENWVALLGWAAAAWMCRARDPWIGWSRPQQWERLRFVVNNARFLILPDVHIPNLASKVLALNCRRLADDWGTVYDHRIALAETFVDPSRFAGTAYQAARWQCLGHTRGFARHQHHYVR